MIVTGHQQHAAMLGGAGMVGVLEGVAAAIHARALRVPQREHAVVLAGPDQIDLLRAPHRGGGEVFVDAGPELDVMGLEMLLGAPQRFVQSADRGAAITGDEPGRIEPGRLVAPALHQRQTHQRLDAREVDPPGAAEIAVVETGLAQCRAQRQRIVRTHRKPPADLVGRADSNDCGGASRGGGGAPARTAIQPVGRIARCHVAAPPR